VAPNITFLRKPCVQTLHGLRVAVLPGCYNEIAFKDDSKMAASAAAAEGEYRYGPALPILLAQSSDEFMTLIA
jgi:hypothetical protein